MVGAGAAPPLAKLETFLPRFATSEETVSESTVSRNEKIFTHNYYGEYGHGDHKQVHKPVVVTYLKVFGTAIDRCGGASEIQALRRWYAGDIVGSTGAGKGAAVSVSPLLMRAEMGMMRGHRKVPRNSGAERNWFDGVLFETNRYFGVGPCSSNMAKEQIEVPSIFLFNPSFNYRRLDDCRVKDAPGFQQTIHVPAEQAKAIVAANARV